MEFLFDWNILIIISFGLVMGFLSAIPVGAVQLEVAKKAINGHFAPAIAVIFGSVTSDFIYGILTLFGLGSFLLEKEFQTAIYILGISVLSFLFFRSLKEYLSGVNNKSIPLVLKKRKSFLAGFTIAITNPGMIIWWLIGYKLLLNFSISPSVSSPMKMTFILSGCTGLGGYLTLIASFLHKLQKSFSDRFLQRMNLILMILLTIIILYFSLKLISIVFNYDFNLP